MRRRSLITGLGIMAGLIGGSVVFSLFSEWPWWQSLRLFFGVPLVLFLPGFGLSYVFYPASDSREDSPALDGIERILLSLALSMVVTPLTLFVLNYFGIAIQLGSILVVTIGWSVAGLLISRWRRK